MQYRHEVKHEISYSDMLAIKQRLNAVAKADEHAKDGKYIIRSLYFDTLKDKALNENLTGVSRREKYRIRYYNNDLTNIRLERKTKISVLGYKDQCSITKEECEKLIEGDYSWMLESGRDLIVDLYISFIFDCLRPKSIVEYTRAPYVYDAGNVRVTFDYDIKTSSNTKDFLDKDCQSLNISGDPIILEIKWDNFLPDIIKDCIRAERCQAQAFSKYAASRAYE